MSATICGSLSLCRRAPISLTLIRLHDRHERAASRMRRREERDGSRITFRCTGALPDGPCWRWRLLAAASCRFMRRAIPTNRSGWSSLRTGRPTDVSARIVAQVGIRARPERRHRERPAPAGGRLEVGRERRADGYTC